MVFLLSEVSRLIGGFKGQVKGLGSHLPWGALPGRGVLSQLNPVENLTCIKRSQAKISTASPAEKEISTSETEHLGFYCWSVPLHHRGTSELSSTYLLLLLTRKFLNSKDQIVCRKQALFAERKLFCKSLKKKTD